MSSLIIYISRHGCAEKTADMLKEQLHDDVIILNLKDKIKPDLSIYNTVIIGGSIHAGKIQKEIKKFSADHIEHLKTKNIGLYLCCMKDGEEAKRQMQDAYPEELRKHAAAIGFFGGEFDFSKMNFFEKFIVKKVANIRQSVSRIDRNAIKSFAEQIQQSK